MEDGRRQEITSFAYVSNVTNSAGALAEAGTTSSKGTNIPADPKPPPPIATEISRRRIAFVVDDYGLSAQSMTDVKRQLRKFIDEQLDPNDLIAIIRTSRARRELPHFTNDRSLINKEWEQVETFNKRFHKLKARVKKGGFEVRTRSGFFGMSEEEAKQLKETSKQ